MVRPVLVRSSAIQKETFLELRPRPRRLRLDECIFADSPPLVLPAVSFFPCPVVQDVSFFGALPERDVDGQIAVQVADLLPLVSPTVPLAPCPVVQDEGSFGALPELDVDGHFSVQESGTPGSFKRTPGSF